MRRRVELALIATIVALGAAFVFRGPLRSAAWGLRGAWETVALPSLPALHSKCSERLVIGHRKGHADRPVASLREL